MVPTAHFRSPLLAIGLSTLAVGTACALQSAWFFPDELEALLRPRAMVRQVAVGDGGRTAWVTSAPAAAFGPRSADHCVRLVDLTQNPPQARELQLPAAPQQIACSPQGGYGFVSTTEGELYAIPAAGDAGRPIRFGVWTGGFIRALACSPDSSRVIAAGQGLSAWDHARGHELWRRTDLQALGGDFDSSGKSYFCCLSQGGILELDSATGATVRRIGEDEDQTLSLAVSPNGAWLACRELAQVRLIDRRTGATQWLQRCLLPVQPRFLAGGRTVLVANLLSGEALAVLDLNTGRPVTTFPSELPICGLAATSTGSAYIWSGTTIGEMDLTSGQVLRTFRP